MNADIAVLLRNPYLAAAMKQARISIQQELDHNALYHVLQAIALVLLYQGFLTADAAPERVRPC